MLSPVLGNYSVFCARAETVAHIRGQCFGFLVFHLFGVRTVALGGRVDSPIGLQQQIWNPTRIRRVCIPASAECQNHSSALE